mmetsp:Transcript_8099/g.24522  ORF Transcript_8099/g.24522 Transcript_8099/m.24522 type:complete len:320 (+) Transcript_8099:136-1095(+)
MSAGEPQLPLGPRRVAADLQIAPEGQLGLPRGGRGGHLALQHLGLQGRDLAVKAAHGLSRRPRQQLLLLGHPALQGAHALPPARIFRLDLRGLGQQAQGRCRGLGRCVARRRLSPTLLGGPPSSELAAEIVAGKTSSTRVGQRPRQGSASCRGSAGEGTAERHLIARWNDTLKQQRVANPSRIAGGGKKGGELDSLLQRQRAAHAAERLHEGGPREETPAIGVQAPEERGQRRLVRRRHQADARQGPHKAGTRRHWRLKIRRFTKQLAELSHGEAPIRVSSTPTLGEKPRTPNPTTSQDANEFTPRQFVVQSSMHFCIL